MFASSCCRKYVSINQKEVAAQLFALIQRDGGHKNIGFLSNTGPDPLKNHKATKPLCNVGPIMARF